jgi:hypothetical protein
MEVKGGGQVKTVRSYCRDHSSSDGTRLASHLPNLCTLVQAMTFFPSFDMRHSRNQKNKLLRRSDNSTKDVLRLGVFVRSRPLAFPTTVICRYSGRVLRAAVELAKEALVVNKLTCRCTDQPNSVPATIWGRAHFS